MPQAVVGIRKYRRMRRKAHFECARRLFRCLATNRALPVDQRGCLRVLIERWAPPIQTCDCRPILGCARAYNMGIFSKSSRAKLEDLS